MCKSTSSVKCLTPHNIKICQLIISSKSIWSLFKYFFSRLKQITLACLPLLICQKHNFAKDLKSSTHLSLLLLVNANLSKIIVINTERKCCLCSATHSAQIFLIPESYTFSESWLLRQLLHCLTAVTPLWSMQHQQFYNR